MIRFSVDAERKDNTSEYPHFAATRIDIDQDYGPEYVTFHVDGKEYRFKWDDLDAVVRMFAPR